MYLAGNFVIMGDKEKEKEFQSRLEPCLRLGTFFYKKELNTLLSIKKEKEDENKKIEGQEKSTKNKDNKISQNSKKGKTSKNKKRRIIVREKRNS
jgi:hypothetical protein